MHLVRLALLLGLEFIAIVVLLVVVGSVVIPWAAPHQETPSPTAIPAST